MPNFNSKEERNAYFREYRKKNKEHIKRYKREYAREWRKGKPYTASIVAWRNENPEKIKAQKFLRLAIKYGYVVRKPCEVCGNEKSHGHHEDYNKPLDVQWLCAEHHKEEHPKNEDCQPMQTMV